MEHSREMVVRAAIFSTLLFSAIGFYSCTVAEEDRTILKTSLLFGGVMLATVGFFLCEKERVQPTNQVGVLGVRRRENQTQQSRRQVVLPPRHPT
jgi:hypothetical protein